MTDDSFRRPDPVTPEIGRLPLARRRLLQATTALAATAGLPVLPTACSPPALSEETVARAEPADITVAPEAPSRGVTVTTHPTPGLAALREDDRTPVWRIAAADDPAFQRLVGTTYTRLHGIVEAVGEVMEAAGTDAAIRLPAGEFVGYGGTIATHARLGTLALIGSVDADNRPATAFQPGRSAKGFTLHGRTDAAHAAGCHLHLQNLRIGTLPSVEAAEATPAGYLDTAHRSFDDLVRHSFGGDLIIVACELVGTHQGDGLKAAGVHPFYYRHARVLVFDTEFRNAGGGGLRHNIYVAGLREFRMVRSTSTIATSGHAVKLNTPVAYVIDSHFANFAPRRAAPAVSAVTPAQATKTARVWWYRCVFEMRQPVANGTVVDSAYDEASRESDWGQWAPWMPWPFRTRTAHPRSGSVLTHWQEPYGQGRIEAVFGGTVSRWLGYDPANPIVGDWVLPPDTPVIWLQEMGWYGQTVPVTKIPTVGETYDLRLLAISDAATGAVSAWEGRGVFRRSEAAGRYYFDIGADAPRGVGFAIHYKADDVHGNGIRPPSFWVAKLPDAPWPRLEPNPAYWNPSDPDYYWSKIDDGNGRPDYVNAQRWLGCRWFTDCLVLGDHRGDFGEYFELENAVSHVYTGRSSGASLPRPPLNYPRPAGEPPPAGWPDVEGAAEWSFYTDTTTMGFPLGPPGRRDDYVPPFFHAFRDVGVRGRRGAANGDAVAQQIRKRPNRSHADYEDAPALHLTPAGTVDELETRASPFAVAATPEVVGAHPAGARQLAVTDTAGMAPGQKVHLRYAPKRGRRQLHVTAIRSVDGRGRVTLAQAIDHPLDGGEEIASFAPAGPKPAWWNDGVG